MFCINCGKELSDRAKFCYFCGTKTGTETDAEAGKIKTEEKSIQKTETDLQLEEWIQKGKQELLYQHWEQANHYFEQVVKVLGIGDKLEFLPNQLSGGQQQRAAIARAIATRPPIIMADEPTGALDSRTGRHVLEILHNLHDDGSTVILITHDNGIAATAERVVRLSDGRIIYDGSREGAFT